MTAGRPVWCGIELVTQHVSCLRGTCAGLILLSNTAVMQRVGGQALVGGLDIHVCRNYFGSQLYSCELDLNSKDSTDKYGDLIPSRAVFIRAPAVLKVGEGVEVIASVRAKPHPSARKEVEEVMKTATEDYSVVVAVRQGNILGTAFHPELTNDTRWHKYVGELNCTR